MFTGCDLVTSFEPLSGKKLWEVTGATTECVTSTVTDGNVVITSGGYPKNHYVGGAGRWIGQSRLGKQHAGLRAFHADARRTTLCRDRCGGGHVLAERHRQRAVEVAAGRDVHASPVMVGEHIFAVNEEGKTFVLKPGLDSVEIVAENQLGDEVFATPTICGGRIYMRVASQKDGNRQEMLYCLGTES